MEPRGDRPAQQIGPYRLLEEVARGGMGIVYRGRHVNSTRDVAVKVLLAGPGASEKQRRRFRREAEAVSRLAHPSLVRLLDVGAEGNRHYLVLEWVTGESLQGRLDRAGPLPPGEAVKLVRMLAGAVSHAHTRGVLHRDLKPANVLLDPAGVPLLTDFGLASELDPSLSRSRLTQEGAFLGTPGFWAPEQARGDLERLGPATDVYGLGALLFALLTGLPPGGETIVEACVLREPPPPSSLNPSVPGWLDRVVTRALHEDPGDRYPTCDAFAEALAEQDGAQASTWTRSLLLWAPLAVLVVVAGLALLMGNRVPPVATSTPASPTSLPPTPATTPDSPDPLESSPETTPATESISQRAAAHFAQGLSLGKAGDWDLAVEAYERALRLEPERANTHFNLAHARAKSGDLEGSIDGYTQLLEIRPRHAGALLNRGLDLGRSGDWQSAIDDFDRALEIQPDYALAYFNRGVAWANLERWRLAESDVSSALEIAPELADAHTERGLARLQLGDLEGAAADFTEQLRLHPDDPSGYAERARVRGLLGDLPGQLADLTQAIESATLPQTEQAAAHHLRAGVREKLGDRTGAIEDYSSGIELVPSNAETHYYLAHLRLLRGELGTALAGFSRVIELQPDHASALSNRAHTRNLLGDYAGGAVDATKAIELEDTLAEAYGTRGEARQELGDLEGAAADYERAVELAPDAPWTGAVRLALDEVRRALESRE